MTPAALRESLRTGLASLGDLRPERRTYLAALIRLRGELEQSRLRTPLPPRFERAAAWTLGCGSVWTQFLAGPIGGAGERQLSLGARANLIVSFFDKHLDSGAPAREAFEQVDPFVREYYEISQPEHRLLRRAIGRMYRAETEPARSDVWWLRKSALPLVAMGLGALGPREAPTGYLPWLYQAGAIAGWIDDAADIERDRRRGQWNRAASIAGPEIPLRRMRRVMEWWDRKCAADDSRDAYLHSLIVWISARAD
jgi:hypothetical protein